MKEFSLKPIINAPLNGKERSGEKIEAIGRNHEPC